MLTGCRSLCCLILAGALAAGCATVRIEQSWRTPNARGSLTNVVALVPPQNGMLSRSAEDELARDLNAHGIRATPGYAVLSGDLRGNNSIALDAIRKAGFDGIVTMRIVGARTKILMYPTYVVYWGATWGTPAATTTVRIEINAYALPENRLVWSAISKATNPDSVHELIDNVAKVAANELAKTGVVARTTVPAATTAAR